MIHCLGLFRRGVAMSSMDLRGCEVLWLSFGREGLDGRRVPLYRILYRLMLSVG